MTDMTERRKKLGVAYSPKYPCPPELFAGRKEYLKFYEDEVLVPKYNIRPAPVNTAFLGSWGIGKTSLLNMIKELGKDEFISIPVIKDFRGIDDILTGMLIKIAASVSKVSWLKEKALKSLKGIGITPFSIEIDIQNRENLIELLIKTWKILEDVGVQHCSILIDDFHLLRDEDMLTLRNIFQFLPEDGCNYSMVVSGTYRTFDPEHCEPVARFFDKRYLGPFTLKESEEVLEKPIEVLKIDLNFDEGYVEELQNLTLGFPYFLKFITLELAKDHKRVKASDIEEHKKELFGALGEAKFKIDYKNQSPNEQMILRSLAEKDIYRFKAKSLKEIPNYTKYLERLCARGLLNWEKRGVYSIYHPLFLEWLKIQR